MLTSADGPAAARIGRSYSYRATSQLYPPDRARNAVPRGGSIQSVHVRRAREGAGDGRALRGGWGALGVFEMLCAVLLVVPAAAKWMPVLTPLAAAALALESLALAGLYARYSLKLTATNPLVWVVLMGLMAAFVATGGTRSGRRPDAPPSRGQWAAASHSVPHGPPAVVCCRERECFATTSRAFSVALLSPAVCADLVIPPSCHQSRHLPRRHCGCVLSHSRPMRRSH